MRPVRFGELESSVSHKPAPAPSAPWIYLGPDHAPPRKLTQKSYHVPRTAVPPEDADALTAAQVGGLLGVTPSLARHALRDAGLKPVARTQWQRLRWRRAEVEAWIRNINVGDV